MTSHLQDGGRDVRPPLAAASAASAGYPLAHRARLTSQLAIFATVSGP